MTREEAIKILASSCITGSKQTEALETLIPELKESEDEKIRRTLVEYFGPQAQLDFVRGVPIQKIRDWLEKQKENPKSADSIQSDCVSDAKCEDRDSNYGVFPEDVIVVARACEKLKTHGYPELAYALKNVNLYTKDQKPAEWSEEDEDNLKRVIRVLEDNDSDWKELTDWLKSLRPSWKPSEEQMRGRGAEWQKSRLTVEDIKTILDLSFWNSDPEKILEEYNRINDERNRN